MTTNPTHHTRSGRRSLGISLDAHLHGPWIRLLYSNSGIVVIETVLNGFILFASFSVLVRLVDAETLGLWFLLNAIIAYSRVVDFWSNGLTSFVAEALGRDERAKALEFVGTAVLTGVLGYSAIAGVSFAALYACAGWIAGPQHAETIRAILPFMAIAFWLNAIAGTYQLGFLGFSRPIFKACQTVGGALVFLAAALLLAPAHGLSGVVLAQMAQGAFMLLLGATAFRLAITRGAPVLRWRAAEFRKLVVFGSKAIIVGSVQLAIEPIIRILVNHFGGLSAVTLVELASRLVAVVRGVIVSLGQVLVPTFARLSAADERATANLYGSAQAAFLMLAVPAFSLMLSAAPLIEDVVLNTTGSGFVSFFWCLSAAWGVSTIVSPAYFLLIARRRLRPLFWSQVLRIAGAIALGYAGGYWAGSLGALAGVAAAFLVSEFYLFEAARPYQQGDGRLWTPVLREPLILLPLVVALIAAMAVPSLVAAEASAARLGLYGLAFALTAVACLRTVRMHQLVQTLARA